ncbi:hypothetical protein CAP35_05955 [Chitinophagaceae bacterium IBVUCB1]|nr:hypothetical protein CAP35_05955 [Chitinophagaceae bacterium IBVUCB1]
MNTVRLITAILAIFTYTLAGAQEEPLCHHLKQSLFQAQSKSTVASAEEDKYDVKHVKLDIALSNENVSISGKATTYAMVVATQMNTYVFELDTLLTIDSVLIDGIKVNVSSDKGLHKAEMPQLLMRGDYFTATVYYAGTPKKGNGFFDRAGMNNAVADQWGATVTYTLSEPYMSKDWWPCKQSLQDKIDSTTIWITVPDSLKAGSNGLLRNVTPMQGNKLRYEWHTNYPMVYYLLSVCVGRYIDYNYKIAIQGGADSMLLQHYIYDRKGALDFYKKGFDSTAQMLHYFSEIFGTYPFYKEKYGHCLAPLSGGMEHQTMSTNGNAGPRLVAHELAHQWFGDWVTCATWRDIWINEGFASYAEYLFLEKFRGKTVARTLMDSVHAQLLPPRASSGSIYADDTANIWRIFDGRLSYNKPSAVLHTLRYVIASDSLFFQILRSFLQTHAFGNASTDDFKRATEKYLQQDMDVFFDQWVYKEGLPIFSTQWNQVGKNLFVDIKQETTNPQSVPVFITPIDIRVQFENVDTTIRVDVVSANNFYLIKTDKKVLGISLDPDNKILNIDRGVMYNPSTGINNLQSSALYVFPNPATNYWVIAGVGEQADWYITDCTGRLVKKGNSGNDKSLLITTESLSHTMYILHIVRINKQNETIKLIKQ